MSIRALLTVLAFTCVAAAQPASQADLALRSRAILAKHCVACHGDKGPRADLSVMDHAQLTTATRPIAWIKAKAPTASQVLELVEQGSMPPGPKAKLTAAEIDTLREWVDGGAGSYPIRFDDEYAYTAVLDDVRKAGDAAANHRYLTLHHLARDGTVGDFLPARRAFIADATSLIKDAAALVPVDPTQTVFRLDLTKAGWHHRPFVTVKPDGSEGSPASANLFDLLLLDYPFGEVPAKSPAFDQLVEAFLVPSKQVRPFPLVRGEWFAKTAGSSPLADDLRELIFLYEPVPAGLSRPKPSRTIAKEEHRLVAVDAWHGADPSGEPTVKGLMVETVDFSKNEERTKFSPGDRFRLRITASERMYFQVVWIDSKGQVDTRTNVESYENVDEPRHVVLPIEGDIGDTLGKERLFVLASPTPFPDVQVWRATKAKKPIERFIHPVFPIKLGKVDTSDDKLTRRTLNIEIVAKDK